MYKNDNVRRKEITKLENDHESGGGFKPKEFKSSRSKPNKTSEKPSSEQMHDDAIFGTKSAVPIQMPVNKLVDKSEIVGD